MRRTRMVVENNAAWHETANRVIVKDENLKNAMMSWYYAGYYTGLAAGQQTAPDEAPGARQKQ